MSLDAIRWAMTATVGSSAERLVLVAYANNAHKARPLAWPGIASLHRDTLLDPKTISSARRRLVERGLLIDTGDRRGSTGRVPVFRLAINASGNGGIQGGGNKEKRMDSTKAMPPNQVGNASGNGGLNDTENGGQNQVVNREVTGSAHCAGEPGEWIDPELDHPNPTHSAERTREQIEQQRTYPERGTPEAMSALEHLKARMPHLFIKPTATTQ